MRPPPWSDPVVGLPFGAAIAFWVLVEWVLGVRSRPPVGAAIRDRGSRAAILLAVAIGVSGAIAVAYAVPQTAIVGPSRLVSLAGVALVVGGELFRLYAIRTLGRYFTLVVALQPGQHVVDRGPYRLIRHPSYTGSLITIFGVCLAMANWLSLLGALVSLPGYLYRIQVEEGALVEGLGDEYRAYQRRTWRLVPYIL